VVTTLAGTAGNTGSADGTGAAARFYSPTGVAVDSAGNLYVADAVNCTIRKVTPAGVVTTLAGMEVGGFGTGGSADGTGTAAQFNVPTGMAMDSAGNLYVADSGNDTIRKVTPTAGIDTLAWVVTTVGGFGDGFTPGIADGAGIAARFWAPGGVAVDSAGTLYVADIANDTIREGSISANGPSAPPITTQPESQTLNSGSTVVFTVTAGGSVQSSVRAGGALKPAATGLQTYHWEFSTNGGATWTDLSDGSGITGSAGPQLLITDASAANAGEYEVVVTNSAGSTTSHPASLVVTSSSNPGLATSISTRAFVGTGDNILIGGFFVVGSTSRTVLVQGLGPALGQFGVTGFLAHPTLSIHQTQNGSDVTLYSDTGWGSSQVLLNAAASVYASPVLPANSPDSELLLTLPPGGYSAEVSGADGGTGVALCAIYELP
jgi:sugar lactone lactonase YvrE